MTMRSIPDESPDTPVTTLTSIVNRDEAATPPNNNERGKCVTQRHQQERTTTKRNNTVKARMAAISTLKEPKCWSSAPSTNLIVPSRLRLHGVLDIIMPPPPFLFSKSIGKLCPSWRVCVRGGKIMSLGRNNEWWMRCHSPPGIWNQPFTDPPG